MGGGSAGCTLAAELSASGKYTVLLIEAGENEYSVPYTHVPGLVPLLQQTSVDWSFKTVPQKFAANGLINQVHFFAFAIQRLRFPDIDVAAGQTPWWHINSQLYGRQQRSVTI